MNYYDEIKQKLIDNEITKKVKDYSKNKSDLDTYYEVGKLLIDAQGGESRAKYGNKLIEEYSKKLTNELGHKYTKRYLFDMRRLYLFSKVHPLDAQLTISHYRIIMSLNDNVKINYYINLCIKNHLSKRELQDKIKSKEYERLPEETKNKLISKEETNVSDFIKNPIVIKNTFNTTLISEKMLKELILEDISSFMKELGDGFCFIEKEYKIKIGNEYNYIDLLLYNIIFNCYTVVELKVTELKKEHVGQIQVYMNYVNENHKKFNQENTIGIIIAREDNQYIMKYCSDTRVFSTKYILNGIK